jgi:hypothetical protein
MSKGSMMWLSAEVEESEEGGKNKQDIVITRATATISKKVEVEGMEATRRL